MMPWLRIFLYLVLTCLVGCGGSGNGGDTATVNDTTTTRPPSPDPDPDPDPEPEPEPVTSPNILLLIADDVGLDASSGYTAGVDLPTTPTLNALAANGLTFDNAWANPVCSPTRAAILTGRYGYRTGVLAPGVDISLNEMSLQRFIDTNVPSTYELAVFG
jgi:hypothetical protein